MALPIPTPVSTPLPCRLLLWPSAMPFPPPPPLLLPRPLPCPGIGEDFRISPSLRHRFEVAFFPPPLPKRRKNGENEKTERGVWPLSLHHRILSRLLRLPRHGRRPRPLSSPPPPPNMLLSLSFFPPPPLLPGCPPRRRRWAAHHHPPPPPPPPLWPPPVGIVRISLAPFTIFNAYASAPKRWRVGWPRIVTPPRLLFPPHHPHLRRRL